MNVSWEGKGLLVLTRRIGEKIEIIVPPSNETQIIKLTLTDVMQNRAKLGIGAKRDVVIRRTDARSTGDTRIPREEPSSHTT